MFKYMCQCTHLEAQKPNSRSHQICPTSHQICPTSQFPPTISLKSFRWFPLGFLEFCQSSAARMASSLLLHLQTLFTEVLNGCFIVHQSDFKLHKKSELYVLVRNTGQGEAKRHIKELYSYWNRRSFAVFFGFLLGPRWKYPWLRGDLISAARK